MGKITKIATPDKESWKELRSRYIGGSDAAAVVGLNPYKSAYSLWAEKVGKLPPFEGNLATEVGTFLEEFVARLFEKETGKRVRRENQSIFNSDYPWAIANVDRVIVGEDAGLEIKTTSELNTRRFKGGEFPATYYCQCVHYMAVTGKARWYLAVLIGNRDFKVFTIDRDEEEIAALMKAEAELFEHIKSKTPPEVDGTSATTEAIKCVYPESDGGEVDLFAFAAELSRFSEISSQIKELEKMKDEISNKVKSYMGNACRGDAGKFRVSYISSTRPSFDVEACIRDYPDIDRNKYTKITQCRTFKVTARKEV